MYILAPSRPGLARGGSLISKGEHENLKSTSGGHFNTNSKLRATK